MFVVPDFGQEAENFIKVIHKCGIIVACTCRPSLRKLRARIILSRQKTTPRAMSDLLEDNQSALRFF